MQSNFDLIITADYPNRTAELRLLDVHGSQIAFRTTDFKTIDVSRQQGLFDLRNYLRHYVEEGKEAASVAEIGVCIAEQVLGEEIFRTLWASESQRTLRIQLPGATQQENHLAAALARVPWEIARPSAGKPTLAERNVLVDQTMVNDFRPFGQAMAKLSTNAKTIERPDGTEVELTTALDKRRRIDSSYEVYLGLYQAITGPEERQKLFREFSPGFFDLIVIDECHRGQRCGRLCLARDPCPLLRRHADRTDRHAQRNGIRFQYPLLRQTHLLLLAQAGHPRRLSCAV
jgi:hypothetical protein